jgi:choline dehydrogenase
MSPDVIVIGGGAAGSVVAGLLSEDPARQVVLLEAGPSDYNPLLKVPLATGYLAKSSMAAWREDIEPDPGLDGRTITWPHGRVLGGSTAINGMVWMRGQPGDYDGWNARGLSGWSWKDALDAYQRIEKRPAATPGQKQGPQPVATNERRNILDETFIRAVNEAGYPLADDINQPPFEGGARLTNTVWKGERWSAARSYLPRNRKNLKIVTGAEVAGIEINQGRATGVTFRRRGRMQTLSASEIVLCAGTVNSSKILMHSGLGPAAHLKARGIPPLVDLPGVGQNLQDHLPTWVAHEAREPVSIYPLTRLDKAGMAVARAMLFGGGDAVTSPFGVGFALRSGTEAPAPDLEGVFVPVINTAIRRPSLVPDGLKGHGYRCAVFVMRPNSRGRIELRGNDPFAAPVIHAGYFSDRSDLELLRKGVELVRKIFSQPAFDRYRGSEVEPGPDITSDAAIEAWIRRNSSTAFHPVGTCKMGNDSDPMAVVDDRLRVRGVAGLRVADASIMPTISSGNTMAPTMMIGQRCVDFMLGNLPSSGTS